MGIRDRIREANAEAKKGLSELKGDVAEKNAALRDDYAEKRAETNAKWDEAREDYRAKRGEQRPEPQGRVEVVEPAPRPAPSCPKCGGTQFKAKRSVKGKMAGGLMAPKSRVECVACGHTFKRSSLRS